MSFGKDWTKRIGLSAAARAKSERASRAGGGGPVRVVVGSVRERGAQGSRGARVVRVGRASRRGRHGLGSAGSVAGFALSWVG